MTHIITCRARVTPNCEHGGFGSGPLRDDGTFDEATQSVICDACYVELLPYTPSGKGLLAELPAAIQEARKGGKGCHR